MAVVTSWSAVVWYTLHPQQDKGGRSDIQNFCLNLNHRMLVLVQYLLTVTFLSTLVQHLALSEISCSCTLYVRISASNISSHPSSSYLKHLMHTQLPAGWLQWCSGGRCVPQGETPLATNGEWGEWGGWSECSRSCGAGVSYRQRHCDNPP